MLCAALLAVGRIMSQPHTQHGQTPLTVRDGCVRFPSVAYIRTQIVYRTNSGTDMSRHLLLHRQQQGREESPLEGSDGGLLSQAALAAAVVYMCMGMVLDERACVCVVGCVGVCLVTVCVAVCDVDTCVGMGKRR